MIDEEGKGIGNNRGQKGVAPGKGRKRVGEKWRGENRQWQKKGGVKMER